MGSRPGQLAKRFAHWKAKESIDRLYLKIKAVRYVKTIWQVEKDVDLMNFYHPSHVAHDGDRTLIRTIDDFPAGDNVIVQGTVGQGKSILFRYLASQEMVRGKAIPVFLELRRIVDGSRLERYIHDFIASLGVDIDNETLRFLMAAGRIVLFLDAFDEVREEQREPLVSRISHLRSRYDKLRVFISSRPGTGIEGLNGFTVCELSPLRGDEYKSIIRRMVHSKQNAEAIIKAVAKQPGVLELLDKPLLIALLVIRYRAEQSVPENGLAFYDKLFGLLLNRHDKLKAGYRRPRKAGLSDGELEDVFNAVSFLLRKSGLGAPRSHEMRQHTRDALAMHDLDAKPDLVIDDIVRITCLLLEEGGEYRYIHKSVQEFHAACFVRNQPDTLVKSFYTSMLTRWPEWEEELRFLEKMDQHRCNKYFLVPDLRRALSMKKGGGVGNPRPHVIPLWLRSLELGFDDMEGGVVCRYATTRSRKSDIMRYWCASQKYFWRLVDAIADDEYIRGICECKGDGSHNVTANKLLKDPVGRKLCHNVLHEMKHELEERMAQVIQVESRKPILSFDTSV